MLDFWLERTIDWNILCNSKDDKIKENLWFKTELLRSKLPYVEQIETTNLCSFSCVMCPRGQGKMTRNNKEMSMDLFKSIVSQIEYSWKKQLNTKRDPKLILNSIDYIEEVGLRLHHFGSPLLDKRLIERIEYIKKYCSFPIHMSISAEHLSQNISNSLLNTNIERLVIALDGNDQDSYASVRGPNVNYDKACENINYLISLKKNKKANTIIDIQYINLNQNQNEIYLFEKKWNKIGVNSVIKPFFPYPDIPKYVQNNDDAFSDFCIWPLLSIVITAEGFVVPCCADYNAENIIGNLNNESLENIWNGSKYRDFRRKFFFASFDQNSLCSRCGYFKRGKVNEVS